MTKPENTNAKHCEIHKSGEHVLDKQDQKHILQDVLKGADNFNKTPEHKTHSLEQLTHGNKELEHKIKELNHDLKDKGLYVVGFTGNGKLLLTDGKHKTDPEHRMYQVQENGTIDKVMKWDAAKGKFEEDAAAKKQTATDNPNLKRDAHNQVTDVNFGEHKRGAHIDYDSQKQDHVGHALIKTITVKQPNGEELKLHNTGKGYYEDDGENGKSKGKYWAGVDQQTGTINFAKLDVHTSTGDLPIHRTTLNPDGSSVTHVVTRELENGPITHVDSANNNESWEIKYKQDGKKVDKVTVYSNGQKYTYDENQGAGYFNGLDSNNHPDGSKYFVFVDPKNGDLNIAKQDDPTSLVPLTISDHIYRTALTPEK